MTNVSAAFFEAALAERLAMLHKVFGDRIAFMDSHPDIYTASLSRGWRAGGGADGCHWGVHFKKNAGGHFLLQLSDTYNLKSEKGYAYISYPGKTPERFALTESLAVLHDARTQFDTWLSGAEIKPVAQSMPGLAMA